MMEKQRATQNAEGKMMVQIEQREERGRVGTEICVFVSLSSSMQ